MALTTKISLCPICDGYTNMMRVRSNSYQSEEKYDLNTCQYCDLQYVEHMVVPDNLYEQIYDNASMLPGYNRYSYYQKEVLNKTNPLQWLSQQEPAYWFIKNELEYMQKNASVLEIGSGLGYLTFSIKKHGYNVIGIDISAKAVLSARSLFGNLYAHKDIFLLSAESQRYDIIILTEVIEHVSKPIDFIKAASAVLKPGGKILMTTPNKSSAKMDAYWETENPPVHLWWFSETSVRQMARRANMSVEFCDYTPMYTGKYIDKIKPPNVGNPPWLDRSGNITDSAKEWLISYNRSKYWTRKVNELSPSLFRMLRYLNIRRQSLSKIAERSWQIGAVLQNPT